MLGVEGRLADGIGNPCLTGSRVLNSWNQTCIWPLCLSWLSGTPSQLNLMQVYVTNGV